MRHLLAIAGAAALATLSTAAFAQATAPAAAAASVAKIGRLVYSSDGKRIGRIDRVDATRVGVIVETTYVYLPTATLSAGENNRVVTSLSFKDAVHR